METQDHSPSPPLPPSHPSLPSDINTATRSLHTRLNRLITARLPLALPPHASNPTAYALGLRVFAQLYFAFEARWTELIAAQTALEDPWVAVETYGEELLRRRQQQQQQQPDSAVVQGEDGEREEEEDGERETERQQRERVMQVLADLLPPGLMRTRRLEGDLADLETLTTATDDGMARLEGKVEDIVARIGAVVEEKPWVLVAYAWVMYMAIFSGGRWIRQQLMDAGPGFWGHVEERDGDQWKGLSFLHFEGEEDGEDIKAEFKRRLAAAEEIFDEEQRQNIVEEAKTIFTNCISLVGGLDDMLGGAELMAEPQLLEHMHSAKEVRRAVEARYADRHLRQRSTSPTSPLSTPFLTGLAVVVGCVSWYTYYFASV